MKLFNVDAKIFKKGSSFFLLTKSWKNHPQKLLRIPQMHFFFLTALTTQTAQTEEFLFQNVAYWLTVYWTGDISMKDLKISMEQLTFLNLMIKFKCVIVRFLAWNSLSAFTCLGDWCMGGEK